MKIISTKSLVRSFGNFQDAGSAGNDSSQLVTNLAAKKYIKSNDKNKDGTLEPDEVSFSKESFENLDKNNDGKVSESELRTGLKGKENVVYQYFAKGNVKLTKLNALSSLFKTA